ncbi:MULTISPECIES: DUF4362 domain-containing protein [unclassified Lysinibacillus]|uniref:DUF4362 domain-containing protein n=1 Tax=unclassified Lysinibacillus TaxID=2636778 RepID=UPI00380447DB
MFLTFVFISMLVLMGCSKSSYGTADAIAKGDITVTPSEVHNLERFEQFLQSISKQQEDKIRVTSFTIEGDPIFQDLHYDGDNIQYSYDNTNDAFGGQDKGIKTEICTAITSKGKMQGKTEYYIAGCEDNFDYYLLGVSDR